MMKIIIDYPPNYEKIKEVFPVENADVLFTYGDTIYNPFGQHLRPDLVFHESVHSEQQGDKPEEWWDRYLTDAQFRMEQELHAYGRQVKWVRQNMGSKAAAQALGAFAGFISGPIYGHAINSSVAIERLSKISRQK